jgi:hypothetical protein
MTSNDASQSSLTDFFGGVTNVANNAGESANAVLNALTIYNQGKARATQAAQPVSSVEQARAIVANADAINNANDTGSMMGNFFNSGKSPLLIIALIGIAAFAVMKFK